MNELKETKAELEKWKKHYQSVADVCQKHEKVIQQQNQQINFLSHSLSNAQQAVTLNKDMLHRMGEEFNQERQEMVKLLNKLKAKLREMGYDGNFDNMGN